MEHKEFYSQFFRELGCLKLWEARHSMVLNFIQNNHIKTLLDLGTSESTLLMKVQRGSTVSHVIGLDIDEEALSKAILNLRPQGIQNDLQYVRNYDQSVKLYKGSALQKYPELKEYNFDLITLVQVVEHIEQKDLPRLNQNIFGYLQPKYVWMSTPNCEFNPVFKWKENQKFRHDDHKFEWTRKQFKTYVDKICSKYNYQATITGVGQSLQDEHLCKGFCTQIAIFTNIDLLTDFSQKEQQLTQQFPLELKMEHVNLCWKSNLANLLQSALQQIISICQFKGFLSWNEITQNFKKKLIIKRLQQIDNQWKYDYYIKQRFNQYLANHPQCQVFCSSEGISVISLQEQPINSKIKTVLDSIHQIQECDPIVIEQIELPEETKNQQLQVAVYEQNISLQIYRRKKIARSRKSIKSRSNLSNRSNLSSWGQKSLQKSSSCQSSSLSSSIYSSKPGRDSQWSEVEPPDEDVTKKKYLVTEQRQATFQKNQTI